MLHQSQVCIINAYTQTMDEYLIGLSFCHGMCVYLHYLYHTDTYPCLGENHESDYRYEIIGQVYFIRGEGSPCFDLRVSGVNNGHGIRSQWCIVMNSNREVALYSVITVPYQQSFSELSILIYRYVLCCGVKFICRKLVVAFYPIPPMKDKFPSEMNKVCPGSHSIKNFSFEDSKV